MPVEPRIDPPELRRHLGGVSPIPILPFTDEGEVDLEGHAKNVRYLIDNNHLEGGLERVVVIGGTSLIHHVDPEQLTTVIDTTAGAMGDRGVLIAGLPANMAVAERLVHEQLELDRPPDVFMLMPMEGHYSAPGLLDTYLRFGDRHGPNGGRFLGYMRNGRDLDAFAALLTRSEYFVGVKVGSGLQSVAPMAERVGDENRVIWGAGDLGSTEAVKEGAMGHTSGSGILAIGLSDGINNAYRRGDYGEALRLEDKYRPFEHIRGELGYGYSAFIEAIILSGFDDTEGGVGHPLNPRVSADVAEMIKKSLEPLLPYHNCPAATKGDRE